MGMCVYVCNTCEQVSEGARRALNPLELTVQIVVSLHMGAGSRALVPEPESPLQPLSTGFFQALPALIAHQVSNLEPLTLGLLH